MTKNEYILLKQKDIGAWSPQQCIDADLLIKAETMINFVRWANDNITNSTVKFFLINCVRAHFGSTDVNYVLSALKCYPEWMI